MSANSPLPPEKGVVRFEIQNLGDDDRLPYAKVDGVKACRVGSNIAFSFYQFDYNALANAMAGTSKVPLSDMKLIPVAKVVLDLEGFARFRTEFERFVTLLDDEP
jgi:hypothetical protein